MRAIAKYLGLFFTVLLLFALICFPASAANQADLEPTQIGVTTLYSGIDNALVVVVANNAAVAASDFTIKLEYSVSGGEYSQIGEIYASISSSADPYYYPLSLNFNWNPAAAGNYTLRATVDAANTVPESNETNNILVQQVTVVDLSPISVKVRIEGKTATLFDGVVTFSTSTITDKQGNTHTVDHPTALGALDKASRAGHFGFVVSSAWGPLTFIEKVGDDANAGMDGWLCRVNWQGLNVAAVDYSLAAGDEVLWYFGGWTAQPLKLTVDRTSLLATENLSATIEVFDGMVWSAAAGAALQAGNYQYTSDVNGKVLDIALPPGGYTLSASMGTYATHIRSNPLKVVVYLPLVLNHGWNFISVPRRLAEENCTTLSLFASVDTAGHSIFIFNPAAEGWTALKAGDKISPLQGIWIYSNQVIELRPVFDTDRRQVPPAKKLAAGWNAIGFSDFEAATANSSLTSVENLWSTLIGFDSAHQVYEASIINNAPQDDPHSEKRPLSPWKGYWLYMTGEGELAAVSQ
jgi:hypothetical protein